MAFNNGSRFSLNVARIPILFGVSIHFLFSACAQSPKGAIIEQSISFNENKVNFCAQLINTGDQWLLISAPFSLAVGDQLFLLTRDENGHLVSLVSSGVIPGAPSPSPYPNDRINYDVLRSDTTLQSCKTYELSNIKPESVESYFIYEPWLRRSDELPFNDTELSVMDGPIYRDEKLSSAKCSVNFTTQVVTCD